MPSCAGGQNEGTLSYRRERAQAPLPGVEPGSERMENATSRMEHGQGTARHPVRKPLYLGVISSTKPARHPRGHRPPAPSGKSPESLITPLSEPADFVNGLTTTDGKTVCRFRLALVAADLPERLFAELDRQLEARAFVKSGTLIDASLIEADVKGRPPRRKARSRSGIPMPGSPGVGHPHRHRCRRQPGRRRYLLLMPICRPALRFILARRARPRGEKIDIILRTSPEHTFLSPTSPHNMRRLAWLNSRIAPA
jgi:hypothetical protein